MYNNYVYNLHALGHAYAGICMHRCIIILHMYINMYMYMYIYIYIIIHAHVHCTCNLHVGFAKNIDKKH